MTGPFNQYGELQSGGTLTSNTVLTSGDAVVTYTEPKPWFRASIKPYLHIIWSYITSTVAGYVPLSSKGQPNGVAPLNAAGKVETAYLTITGLNYKGSWNGATNTPTLANGIGANGDFYLCTVAGTLGGTTYSPGDGVVYNGTVWQRVGRDDAVLSVNGKIGAVVLTSADVAEGVTNLYFTDDRGRSITLSGLSTTDATPITQSDTLITALGKLQAQLNKKSWIEYASQWDAEPTLVGTSTLPYAGDVYQYIWGGVTRYRLVPTTYTPAADTFYATFAGGVCSSPIVSRNSV